MNDKELRKAVIKLAHDNPGLRNHLLPLVKEAGAGLSPGDKVVVKDTHGTKEFRGQKGTVEKYVPFNKFYVDLEKAGRTLVDKSDLKKQASQRTAASDAPSMGLGSSFYASSLAVARAVSNELQREGDFAEIKVEKPYSPARFSASSIVSFKVTYMDSRPDASGWISVTHEYSTADARPALTSSFNFAGKTGTLINLNTDWDDGSKKVAQKYAPGIVKRFFQALM